MPVNREGEGYKPFTLLAEVHCDLLGDSLRDVYLSTQAGYTHVGWVGRNGNSTGTAQAGEEKSNISQTQSHKLMKWHFTFLNFRLFSKDNISYSLLLTKVYHSLFYGLWFIGFCSLQYAMQVNCQTVPILHDI